MHILGYWAFLSPPVVEHSKAIDSLASGKASGSDGISKDRSLANHLHARLLKIIHIDQTKTPVQSLILLLLTNCIMCLQGKTAISDISAEWKDGFIACTFKRQITHGNFHVFNLNKEYYLLLGVGPMRGNSKQKLHYSLCSWYITKNYQQI